VIFCVFRFLQDGTDLKIILYLMAALLVLSSIGFETTVQAKGAGANAGHRKQARITARANRRQSRGAKVQKDVTQWVGHDRSGKVQGQLNQHQNIEVENDETHTVGHDRSRNRFRKKRGRTETVDNNETITVNSSQVNRPNSLMEEEGISYYRKRKGHRRLQNAN
jgi:hypothetical protein